MNDLAYQIAVRDVSSRGDAESFYRLGCLLYGEKRWGAAAGCFARVVELEPGNYRAWTNLGWSRHQGGRSTRGLMDLSEAVRLAPGEGTPHALLSQIELMFGRVDASVREARRSIECDPRQAVNHMALGFALAAKGEWAEAWQSYEQRIFYKLPEFTSRPYRWWRGEKVETLYLEAEQGAGDAIFSLRWVPLAAACAQRVVLYVHQPLYSLVDSLCELPGNVEVYPLPRPLPYAEAWCPLLSLPVALDDGEPWGEPCIRGFWDSPGVLHDPPQNVAICWAGNPTHEQAHHRDCPLVHFLPLSEVPGVRLHSIQVGPAQTQFQELACYGLIEDRSPEITNFADTAKIISTMDLVITVDTAVAHLAGAMGVPCWMLVNRRGMDFRWPVEPVGASWHPIRTPWYPSMRLFRRELGEGWPDVINRVCEALRGIEHCPNCGSLLVAGKCIRCEEER